MIAPWRSSPPEAQNRRAGFAGADAFWQMLWWGILADMPTRLDRIDCPVILAQGTASLRGQVIDDTGAVISGAHVVLIGSDGKKRTTTA